MKNNTLHIGIVSANPYSENKGVAALAYSILFILKNIEVENKLSFTYTFFGSEGYTKDTIEINGKQVKFQNYPKRNMLTFKGLLKLVIYSRCKVIIDVLKLNLVFDISEGDSYSDLYGVRRFSEMNNTKIFFNRFHKKQCLLPQTIGPFTDSKVKLKAFKMLRKIDCIFTRDRQSYDYILANIEHSNIHNSIDVAFALPFVKKRFNNKEVNIGISVSELLWNGGYTKNNQFGLKTEYKELITKIINYFCNLNHVKLHFVAHVSSENPEAVEDDYRISLVLHEKFPKTEMAPKFNNPIEAKNYISGLDYFIGSRMHACIAAFSSNVPVFPLAYSRKFNGLFVDTLDYPFLGDLINLDESTIMEKLIDAFNNRLEIKKNILEKNSFLIQQKNEELKNTLLSFILREKQD